MCILPICHHMREGGDSSGCLGPVLLHDVRFSSNFQLFSSRIVIKALCSAEAEARSDCGANVIGSTEVSRLLKLEWWDYTTHMDGRLKNQKSKPKTLKERKPKREVCLNLLNSDSWSLRAEQRKNPFIEETPHRCKIPKRRLQKIKK